MATHFKPIFKPGRRHRECRRLCSRAQVHRLGNGAANERLGSGHHTQMGHVADAAPSAISFESAIEDRQVFCLKTARDALAVFLNILDRIELLDVSDGRFNLTRIIAESMQSFGTV